MLEARIACAILTPLLFNTQKYMKTLKCDLCDTTKEAETFEAWMEAMMPHYMEAHADFMKEHGEKSEEEQKKLHDKWMVDMKAKFEEE